MKYIGIPKHCVSGLCPSFKFEEEEKFQDSEYVGNLICNAGTMFQGSE
jgi:hypothetical protein